MKINYNNKNIKIVDGMVFCPEIDKWVDAGEYIYNHCIYHAKQDQARELQEKIAKTFKLN